MKILINIRSFEDLKNKYRTLALKLHPDRGGNLEQMQELNREYDILFPVWKRNHNATVAVAEQVTETAQENKRKFYTQNGWEGKNYVCNLSTTEIAKLIRQYAKTAWPDWKFSVTSEYYLMGAAIRVYLMEGPEEIYVPEVNWNEEQQYEWRRRMLRYEAFHCSEKELKKYKLEAFMLESVQSMLDDVSAFVNSYNFDDSDSMIDYFHCNFHFLKIGIGKWDRPYKVVTKQPKPERAPKQRTETADVASGLEFVFKGGF